MKNDIFLKNYIHTDKADFFRFSNKDLHGIFIDKSELIISQLNSNLQFKDKNEN